MNGVEEEGTHIRRQSMAVEVHVECENEGGRLLNGGVVKLATCVKGIEKRKEI